MQGYVLWFVAGFVLLIAELTTGTFYLLVIALALAAAGVADLLGAPLVVQLVIAAVIGFGGSLGLRRVRLSKAQDDSANPMQQLDVGQKIRIDQWSDDGTARANYRGALWDVTLMPGETAEAGAMFEIKSVEGSRLMVRRAR